MKLRALNLLAALCLYAVNAFAQLTLTESMPTISQNFDDMYANGEPSLNMPEGWRVDRHMSLPREINTWDNCSTTVMYSGGVSLAANASNGTYNFGNSADHADRAVGGISTGGAGTVDRTKGFSILTSITNKADKAIDRLTLSYDIEKYRKGANSVGFVAQLYTSTDGKTWSSAGSDFATVFTPDAVTEGAAVVPIETTNVKDRTLKIDIATDDVLYLAWNISVVSGTAANAAMALALDNVSITAGFATGSKSYVYVENAARWKTLLLSVGDNTATEAEGKSTVNGVEYHYFPTDKQTDATLTLTNNTVAHKIENINLNQDVYLCLSKSGITTIADPQTYTGWTDPDRKPFKSSGIYLRGEINSWNAVAEWEFSDEGDGLYVLYDKTLSGSFKVADASWSSKCNYGSNGAQVLMDTPYPLVLGTNDNISVGGNTYLTKRIVLNIGTDNASLLLESADAGDELTSVYVIGDFNDWNYMSTSGELKLLTEGDNAGKFAGTVTLHPANEQHTSAWRIYQGLGMSGVWGASDTEGVLEKGSTQSVLTAAGTYDFLFDINTGAYTLTAQQSVLTEVQLQPKEVYLVANIPAAVRVLSLNNSLINYNNQASVFTELARAVGKDADWTPHSILGQPLSTHFNETGTSQNEEHQQPAKDMVRSKAWSHIILQEQSALPRTNPERFYDNVRQWVNFIRTECPNPNAVIILPLNWAYAGDWTNFSAYNAQFLRNYLVIARELGLVVCPVGTAYQFVYDEEGTAGIAAWFQDDRHPTNMSTYMAACLEYAVIYGEDPTTLTWRPASVSEQDAQKMRLYAKKAAEAIDNCVDHVNAKVKYSVLCADQFGMRLPLPEQTNWQLSGGGELREGVFTSNKQEGEFTVTLTTEGYSSEATIKVVNAVPYNTALYNISYDTDKIQILVENGNIYIRKGESKYSLSGSKVEGRK